MSLGDLNKSVNRAGASDYNARRAEILRQGQQAAARQAAQEADKLNQEISHLRLHKDALEAKIIKLKNEIPHEKDLGERSFKERELHRLLGEKTHLQGEIIQKQGRERAAHNVHFNNPHYF